MLLGESLYAKNPREKFEERKDIYITSKMTSSVAGAEILKNK